MSREQIINDLMDFIIEEEREQRVHRFSTPITDAAVIKNIVNELERLVADENKEN